MLCLFVVIGLGFINNSDKENLDGGLINVELNVFVFEWEVRFVLVLIIYFFNYLFLVKWQLIEKEFIVFVVIIFCFLLNFQFINSDSNNNNLLDMFNWVYVNVFDFIM